MGYTIAQKIFNEHLGHGASVAVGQEIGLVIDQCLTQDSTGTMAWLEFESLGFDCVRVETAVSYVDHTNLGFKGESAEDHVFLQTVASRYGAIFSKPGNGVCHQVHYERLGAPGKTLLGSDSHTPTAGCLGMIGIGVGGMDVAVALGGGLFYLRVPATIKVHLTGYLSWGVGAKDVILEVLKRLSVNGARGRILEYAGEGVPSLSVPERATITNMGAETGAMTSVFPSDGVTRQFLEDQERGGVWRDLKADEDAEYEEVIEIDLSTLGPSVAMPGSPDNVRSIVEVKGTKVDQVHIGSCTNGNWRDFHVAAQVLRGKKVSPDCEVMVVPGSRQVQQMLLADGSYEALVQAGCRVMEPGCGPCIGMGFVPGGGHLSLRTVNRNWAGRGGNKYAQLALASAEVAAATALKGELADPRKLDPVETPHPRYIIDDSLLLQPKGPRAGVRRGKNIVPLRPQMPLEATLTGEVLLKVGDGVSTDDILPAGPLTQHLRSNLPEISKFVYYYQDETFAGRAVAAGGGFIVAGENYGQGSSREHAALGPRQLGVKAALAKSFARIHRANLINTGILPLVCNTDQIQQGDRLEMDVHDLASGLVVQDVTRGLQIPVVSDFTDRERSILKAGGILAHTKGAGHGRSPSS
jgi:aconitate hydratase